MRSVLLQALLCAAGLVAMPSAFAQVVTNAGFETPALAANSYVYCTGMSPGQQGAFAWTGTGGAVLQNNSTVWGLPPAPEGRQTIAMFGVSSISQSVYFPTSGVYQLTWRQASLADNVNPIWVQLDGVNLQQFGTAETTWGTNSCQLVITTAGNHTIGFVGTAPFQTAGLDQVTISLKLALFHPQIAQSFVNPPNEYRLVQYQLNSSTLWQYPAYGIGGYMAFFYENLYQNLNGGVTQIGPLVNAANAQGRPVWLADDFGFPSGMAGGRVVAQNPAHEVRGLTLLTTQGSGTQAVTLTIAADMENAVAAVIYPLTNGVMDLSQGQVRPVTTNQVQTTGLAGAWQLCLFGTQIRNTNTQAQSTMEFGHTGHTADLLNSNAVASFITNMHAPMLAQLTNPATQVEGFYANEPNLEQLNWNTTAPHACVSWNADLPARFQQMHGYDLIPVLSALFAGTDNQSRRVRMHFYETVADRLAVNFGAQLREWCNARGVHSSGHFLLAEYLSMQVPNYGDYLKLFSEFDVPAYEIGIPNPEGFNTYLYYQTARFADAVAVWKERNSTICLLDPLIMGGSYSRVSPAIPLLQNSVNMACLNGANVFSSYMPLVGYTNTGSTATGYTTNDYRALNEYIGRCSTLLRGAKRDASVALYYPIAMFQADYRPSTQRFWDVFPTYAARQWGWDGIQQALLAADLDYAIVHPEAVPTADVQNGVMKIGRGSYRYLIMPQVEIIPLAVLQKLQVFEAGGGKVLWVDQKPYMGATAAEDAEVQQRVSGYATITTGQIAENITNPYASAFRLNFSTGTSNLYAARFYQSNGYALYYLVNRQQTNLTVQISSAYNAMADLYNPFDGSIDRVTLPAQTTIPAVGSLLVLPVQPPQFASQPAAKNAMIPCTVRTLSVEASGVLPLSYQWRSNGVAIAGATAASLTVDAPGSYDVVVTGADSLSATSTVAQVFGTMVNGTFGDLTGMTNQGGGWYAGLPTGWTGPSGDYAVNTNAGATPPVANLNVLTNLSQTVGTLTNTSDVVLRFDFSHPSSWGGSLPVMSALILTNAVVMVSNRLDYNNYGTKNVVATGAPAGASLTVKFVNESAFNAPALDNVSAALINASYPTEIIQQPDALSAMIPGTVRVLSVGALGVSPLSYQWRSNNVAISGANAASLTVTKSGNYDVVVTGGNSLSVTSTAAQVVGGVLNGSFSDLTGLSSQGGGWYAGLPFGWTGSAGNYSVNTSVGATPPTCNPSTLGVLRQSVGMVTNTSDVVLGFDNNTAFANGSPWTLGVAILNSSLTPIVSSSFSPGLSRTLVASNVPPSTVLSIQFTAVAGFPGLDNVVANASAVTPPASPTISTTVTGNSLTLSWPLDSSGFQLYGASNLFPPVVWVPESAVLQTNQQSISATVPIGSGTRFFRLVMP